MKSRRFMQSIPELILAENRSSPLPNAETIPRLDVMNDDALHCHLIKPRLSAGLSFHLMFASLMTRPNVDIAL